MPVVRIARQRLRMGDELTALAVLESGGNADLDAELVRFVRLALADALHLGRVQAVDLGTALSALLSTHPPRQAQQPGEFGFEPGIAARSDLAIVERGNGVLTNDLCKTVVIPGQSVR
jgi:hypothetical protein